MFQANVGSKDTKLEFKFHFVKLIFKCSVENLISFNYYCRRDIKDERRNKNMHVSKTWLQ